MEVLVLILVVVAIAAIAAPVALRLVQSRRRAPELEPPPVERVPAAPPEVEAETVAEIEEALADALTEAPPEAPPEEAVAPPPVRPSFRDRLGAARSLFAGYVSSVLSRSAIDQDSWDDLEEALIRADVGVATTTELLETLRKRAESDGLKSPDDLVAGLKDELKVRLAGDRTLRVDAGRPNVWLFVGVNGVGKTTTIAKVSRQEMANGRTVIMAAADTFRAAATEQLELWADRVGVELVRGNQGGDPSAVVFDAVQRAAARGYDLVLADTAGRLHTKTNLMEELRKLRRVADREPGVVSEVLLVLDATTGQNGLAQARQFTEAVDVTGVVLTKLDGSAKGGIVLAIQSDLGIPVKLVGLGETFDDLVAFDADEFVDALFE